MPKNGLEAGLRLFSPFAPDTVSPFKISKPIGQKMNLKGWKGLMNGYEVAERRHRGIPNYRAFHRHRNGKPNVNPQKPHP